MTLDIQSVKDNFFFFFKFGPSFPGREESRSSLQNPFLNTTEIEYWNLTLLPDLLSTTRGPWCPGPPFLVSGSVSTSLQGPSSLPRRSTRLLCPQNPGPRKRPQDPCRSPRFGSIPHQGCFEEWTVLSGTEPERQSYRRQRQYEVSGLFGPVGSSSFDLSPQRSRTRRFGLPLIPTPSLPTPPARTGRKVSKVRGSVRGVKIFP